ncbi:hypothetical protein KKG41_03900 [Patescibacteria group bacterium]|nr:hypothetical protein [Patescibacteria group bacterium]MBU1890551.1 hypothetical protein [Patescibacteria group bacterium]
MMDEQTPAPFAKKRVDSNMAILLTLTVALVFAWVFYFFYIYQTQEVTFSVTVKQRDAVSETEETEVVDTVTEDATAT